MKKYTITVNGVSYDVTVEEGGAAQSASLPPLSPAPSASEYVSIRRVHHPANRSVRAG